MDTSQAPYRTDGLERLIAQAPFQLVQTPALVADFGAIEANLRLASELVGSAHLRPHFKAHKCSSLLRYQLAADRIIGVTVATVQEACIARDAGVDDILLANEIVDVRDARRLAELARSATVTVAVDHPTHVDLLAEAAMQEAVHIGVLLDIDVGQHRCGVTAGSPELLELARRVVSSRGLRLDGIMGYDGHAQSKPAEQRATITLETAEILTRERARLAAAGFVCRIISGGGTGNMALAASRRVLTEIQAGSYALLDGAYADLELGFTPALFCLSTVISRRGPHEAVADAGLKALAVDEGLPRSTRSDVEILSLSDEHAKLRTTSPSTLQVGDRLLILPQHLDPTVNLHDVIFVWTGSKLEHWAVDARRRQPPLSS